MKLFEPQAFTRFDKFATISTGYTIAILWCYFITLVLNFLYTPFGQYYNPEPIQHTIFFTCIFAPLWEELAFRVVPIQLGLKIDPQIVPLVIVLSSLLFGWGHGGVVNLLIQGVMGLVLSWVYVRNNYSYWSAVILHSLWNTTVTILNTL
jgi:membrane protease YdiL (CAAX protease family)